MVILSTAMLAMTTGMAQADAQEDVCGTSPIAYTVRHVEDNRFQVEASFTMHNGVFDVGWREAEGTQDGQVDFISNLHAVTRTGELLEMEYQGFGTWHVQEERRSDVVGLQYDLLADHDRAVWNIGKEEIAYRFDDSFYFVGSPVMVADYSWDRCAFEVEMDVPGNWQTVSGWATDDGESFRAANLTEFLRNIFVTGPDLEPHYADFEGMRVTILEQSGLREQGRVFQELLEDSVGRYVEMFGSAPMDRYLVVFGEDPITDGGAFANSFGQRMPAPIRMGEKLMWGRVLAHEALHAWLGIAVHAINGWELQWFNEGGTDYLTGKTLYRSGQIDEDELLFLTEGQIRRFFLGRIASGGLDLGEAGQEKQRHRQLVYGGGAMFHLILDAELSFRHGAGRYEAVMRELYENADTAWDVPSLLEFLDERTDGTASEIYAFLNGPFNHRAVMDRLRAYGLSVAAYGPDEILVRYEANGCPGSRAAACMPDFLAR